MKFKSQSVYLLSFLILSVSLFCLYWFWTASPELEDSSQNQTSLFESKKLPEKTDPMNGHENPQEREKNKKTRSLTQTSENPVFETFDLSPEEVELFHGRKHEPREATLAISGLKIDGKAFRVENREDLPLKLVVPLPGGEGKREFTRSFVDFQNRDSFVWVGTAKDNKFDTFHLSFYQGVMVGSIETPKGSYEIKQLTGNKNIIRKIDRSVFPKNEDDVILPKKGRSQKSSLEEVSRQKRQSSEVQSFQEEDVFAQGNVQVDMVLGFSHLIKRSEGSLKAAKALMNNLVSAANTIHRNSKTGVVINVRAMMELNLPSLPSLRNHRTHMMEAYSVETGGTGFDRNNPYHLLAHKRYQTSSDLTALVTERGNDLCGIARFPLADEDGPKTMLPSVTSAACPHDTLAHEIGHNMGAMHARDQFRESEIAGYTRWLGIYPYAYGIRFRGHVGTVMSYCNIDNFRCQYIYYFSNPELSYQSFRLGEVNKMDNSRAIRERSSEIANVSNLRPGLGLQIPQITRQPTGGTPPSSGSLTLEVTAVDPNTPKLSLSYQWYKNNRVLSGENRRSLVLQRSSTGGTVNKYYVKVTNSVGSVSSNEVTVDFRSPPRITRQPTGGTPPSSGSLTLEVTAVDPNTPKLSLSYQWYRNGQALSGKKTNRLVIQSSSATGSHRYYVTVSNSVGQTKSEEVTVSSLKAPRITKQPTGGSINSNRGLTLEVAAVNPNPAPNNGALSYQWYHNKSPVNNEEGKKPRLWVRPSHNFEFQSTYYVEVSYRGKVTRSNVVRVVFGIRLRNSKWEGLLDPATDPSLIEIGQIDRSLDLKRTPEESEEGVMRGLANEE